MSTQRTLRPPAHNGDEHPDSGADPAVENRSADRAAREQREVVKPTALEASKALFIRRWGEMGGYWGINRTMAEIHALLFVSTEPVCTDDVMEKLLISRGNASMNLRSLVDWGLIQRVHIRGDRKEYFVCTTDVWQMFETIIRQRRRREVEPILETIERCQEMVSGAGTPPLDKGGQGGVARGSSVALAGDTVSAAGKASKNGIMAGQEACDDATQNRNDATIYRDRLADMQKFLETVGAMVDMLLQLGPKSMSQLSVMMAGMTHMTLIPAQPPAAR